jgi:hypothetical protein
MVDRVLRERGPRCSSIYGWSRAFLTEQMCRPLRIRRKISPLFDGRHYKSGSAPASLESRTRSIHIKP